MIYQKFFVDILLLFNGMILNYLYFHFYDSRYIVRLSQFQKTLTVCLLALMFVFVYSDFGYCSYIFTSLLGFLFIRIFYHFEEKSEYITQVVFFFILMFSDLFASIFTNLIIRFFDMQRNSVLELSYFSILLTTLIIIILYSFLNAKLIGISYKNLAKKELIIYVGSLVFSWLLCLILISFLLYFKDLLFQFFVCFVILFILLLDLFLVYSAQTKVNNNLLEKEMRIVNQKSDLLMKYYENVKNQDQENSIFRHDLKNHLSVIKDSLPECMSVYVNDIMSHIDKDNIRFYSDNKILEALINDKLDQAKRNGIELSVKCDDTNIEILSDYDLVTILSNLIDNSIDAVNTSISEERQIILRIKEVKNNLVIKIKNTFNNEIRYNKEELMSTKEGHSGLGIKSVKSVVSKYQGDNGCGKSTLLKTLAGIINPMRGVVPSELLNMNFMVSNYISIPEEVKVKDIMLLLGNENCNYVKNKYGNIYQFVEKLERQTVKKLSSGEKKVVEIFSSLALHKKYLLLDEASNALDITNRQFLLDALISVSQKDIVVFYVSHNLNEIIKLNGEVYCFIPKFKTIKKIQNEELIDNRFKDLITFGADSYE